jgi:UDP-N-acetylglucosamine 2-epimerase (non-hydrolysing)
MSELTRVMVVAGTRPEAIKVAPVMRALAGSDDFAPLLCVTRQHDHLLDQALDALDLRPDVDLDVFAPGRSMTGLLATVIERLGTAIVEHRPDLVMVQGDTSSVLAGALAAHHQGVPVAHLEAGLRSGLRNVPFPEE